MLLLNDPNNGTWDQLRLRLAGDVRRVHPATVANNVDVVGRSRLVISDDETFDATDRTVEFNPSGQNGAGPAQRFAPQTAGWYLRGGRFWRRATSPNLGAKQMFFLRTPQGMTPMANPTAINGFTPFNANYGRCRMRRTATRRADGTGGEYASQGGGNRTFVDFDFGAGSRSRGGTFSTASWT